MTEAGLFTGLQRKNKSQPLNNPFKSLSALLRRRIPLRITISTLAFIIIAVSCSHTKPYIRPGIQQFDETCECGESCETDKDIKHRVLLIGDAGAPLLDKNDPSKLIEPTLISLSRQAAVMPGKTTIIFLGDNIYPAGLPERLKAGDNRLYNRAEQRLKAQLSVAETSGARAIFVSGNHDWDDAKKRGNKSIKGVANLFNELSLSESNIYFASDGCPGPIKIDCDGVRMILLDTQWWLHKYDKEIASCLSSESDKIIKFTTCKEGEVEIRENTLEGYEKTEEGVKRRFIEKLKTYLNADGKQIIVAAHHPIATYGPHGGFFDWKYYLSPLTSLRKWLWIPLPPLYPLIRWHFVKNDQDMAGPRNKELVEKLKEALSSVSEKNKPLIYASGHDHSLQVLDGGNAADYILVSGAGSSGRVEESAVGSSTDTIFAHLHPGFMEVDFMNDDRVLLRVVEPDEQTPGCKFVFSTWLK